MATKKKVPAKSTTGAKARPPRTRSPLDRVRALCLAFPEANERVSHGEPTWFAGKGKVFAMFADHHHGSPHVAVWIPMPPGAQEGLVGISPDRFFRPPYVGPSGWVGVVLDRRTDWEELGTLLRDAFLHVATKKLKERVLRPD